MFRVYAGEFLINAAAVELDGEYCSHSCFYCYANIGKPNRTADIKGITRQLANLHDDQSTEAVLIKQGYPVIISNHVDPLSRSNSFMQPVIHSMYEAGHSVILQTKLADDISAVVSDDEKILWCVTIETDRDDFAKKVAPGAPDITTRLKHIEKLTATGHKVVVLMCPYVSAWFEDIAGLVAHLKGIGVSGIWAEPLHLSRKAYSTEVKKKEILTPDQLQDAYKSIWYPEWLIKSCKEEKLPFFSSCAGAFGNIYAGIEKLYPNRMPSVQEFFGKSKFKEFDVIEFADFMKYAAPLLPKGVFNIREYLGQTKHDEFLAKYKLPNNLTFEQLAGISWGMAPEVSNSNFNVGVKNQYLSYIEKDGKVANVGGKPVYALNYELHKVIDL